MFGWLSRDKDQIRRHEPILMAAIIEEGKMGGPQVYMMHLAHQLAGQVKTVVIMPEENSDDFQQRCRELEVPFGWSFHRRVRLELRLPRSCDRLWRGEHHGLRGAFQRAHPSREDSHAQRLIFSAGFTPRVRRMCR